MSPGRKRGVKGDRTPIGKILEKQLAKARNEDVGNFPRIYFPLNVGEESEERAGKRQGDDDDDDNNNISEYKSVTRPRPEASQRPLGPGDGPDPAVRRPAGRFARPWAPRGSRASDGGPRAAACREPGPRGAQRPLPGAPSRSAGPRRRREQQSPVGGPALEGTRDPLFPAERAVSRSRPGSPGGIAHNLTTSREDQQTKAFSPLSKDVAPTEAKPRRPWAAGWRPRPGAEKSKKREHSHLNACPAGAGLSENSDEPGAWAPVACSLALRSQARAWHNYEVTLPPSEVRDLKPWALGEAGGLQDLSRGAPGEGCPLAVSCASVCGQLWGSSDPQPEPPGLSWRPENQGSSVVRPYYARRQAKCLFFPHLVLTRALEEPALCLVSPALHKWKLRPREFKQPEVLFIYS
uniref:uncharacterized protein LOC129501632 n=1 Tax=Nyctereutes procyonoides TaxID=34880 RepID=UPI0024442D42|nr:uncharacterized protein LOC129501632 [Nyctereutes procyonoides]